jgi:hypothetical protein
VIVIVLFAETKTNSMNNRIDLAKAKKMISHFRNNKAKVINPGYSGRHILLDCETFDRAAFDQMLKQKRCEKVRIYYGMDDNMQIHAIIVGVDAEGKDILPQQNAVPGSDTTTGNVTDSSLTATGDNNAEPTTTDPATTTDDEGVIIEDGQCCPPYCTDSPDLYP